MDGPDVASVPHATRLASEIAARETPVKGALASLVTFGDP